MKLCVSRRAALMAMVTLLALSLLGAPVFAGGKTEGTVEGGNVLKIGVLGVMSGAAASWGLVMKYSAEAIAKMFNDEGGVLIDGKKYKVEVISFDEKLDPRLAKTGMERLVYQEKIKYIIGTNTDDTTASSQPVLEAGGAMSITYGFAKDLFRAPHYNTILGMPTPYTTAPIIYKHMMDTYKVKTIAYVARNDADALYERTEGMEAAQNIGLRIVSSKDTYEPGATDFFPVMTKVLEGKPDLIELSGASPGDAPQLIKAGRELGFKGQFCCGTGQDIKIINEIAGKYAEGFVSPGGASTPEIRSPYMEKFIDVYTKIAGEWNDEAGTKCYAPYMVLATLQQAGAKALTDVSVFKDTIPKFSVKNPFLKEDRPLQYVGTSALGHPRQLGVPLVINQVKNGEFSTLFILTEY